ncbi:vitamin K epoxide reductase family protein [Streptomyces sp. 7R007]
MAEGRHAGEPARTAGGGRAFALPLVGTGAAGLPASWVITLDTFELLQDPDFTPGCSLNPVVSCGSVMKSDQAGPGVPQPDAGPDRLRHRRLRRHEPARRRPYRISALCLWCCLAWVATVLVFWYLTSHVVRHRFLPAPGPLRAFLDEFTWVLPLPHTGIVGTLVPTRWWDFWTS